ncbi:DUF4179 domain-containing protein [Paenisporosarcina indica]|uniref:DUF4179 domain-containing protein n=1 Tax=Paenisporosarcina indica TaxID=650093 RepID=UPI00094F55AE|nr:DUF4179 domain-containing protein [Paenisporosarcina indica]
MFENEEEKLNELRKHLEHVDIPQGELEGAILQGLERAKREKQMRRTKRKRGFWILAISALVLITLVTSIRVSPAIANAVASFPGMEKLVSLIHDDKGFNAAIENDYYQEIAKSQTQNGITLTIDGVVSDHQQMLIFYSIEHDGTKGEVRPQAPRIYGENKKKLPGASMSLNAKPNDYQHSNYSSRLEISFEEPIQEEKFELMMPFENDEEAFEFEIPFEITRKNDSVKTIIVNETVTIEGQKITVSDVNITPLRVAIHIEKDPKNSMRIFNFEDLALQNEKGEEWSSATYGFNSSILSDDEEIIYLQSNYFDQPKRLTLTFSKLQAMPKDEAFITIDTDKKIILNQPHENYFSFQNVLNGRVGLGSNVPEDFHFELFSRFVDHNGKESYIQEWSHNGGKELIMKLPTESYENPLTLPFSFYPRWIEGRVEIDLTE